jgi:hypothetical protein
MERSAIELHDSVLVSIGAQTNDVKCELRPAYIHKSLGTPGRDRGQGGWQDVDIVVHGATVATPTSDLPSDLDAGTLVIDDTTWSNVIPIPLERLGASTLVLDLMTGERITIQGVGVSIVPAGEPDFCETFRRL